MLFRSRPWDSPGKNTGVGCHFLLQCTKVKSESEVAQSCPTLATPWTAAYQAPLSMGFSRQEYWSGLRCPPTEDLPDPWIESMSLKAVGFFTTSATWETHYSGLLLLLSRSVMSDSATPWTAAHQASLSFTISQSLLKLMSIESVMSSNHLIHCLTFPSPPAPNPS